LNFDKITDVVWIQTAFLGDIVLSTAAFNILKAVCPHVKQHLITTKIGCEVLKDHPSLSSIHVWNKRKGLSELLAVSKKVKKDLAGSHPCTLQVHRSLRSSLLGRLLGFPLITYEESVFPKRGSIRVPRISLFHECERIALLLEPLGVDRAKFMGCLPFLSPLAVNQGFTNKFNPQKKVIGIAPGSVWATKRWTVDGYRKLIQKIQLSNRYEIVLIGSKEDSDLTHEILAPITQRSGLTNLVGQTSLDELRMLYPQLSGLVSGDSSPVHFASAFGVPSVVIFGATTPEMGFAGRSDLTKVVEISGLSCRPCSVHGPKTCPKLHFRCMRDISAEKVFESLKSLMNEE